MSHKVNRDTGYIDDGYNWTCSTCGDSWLEHQDTQQPYKFCPHCGVALTVHGNAEKARRKALAKAAYQQRLQVSCRALFYPDSWYAQQSVDGVTWTGVNRVYGWDYSPENNAFHCGTANLPPGYIFTRLPDVLVNYRKFMSHTSPENGNHYRLMRGTTVVLTHTIPNRIG